MWVAAAYAELKCPIRSRGVVLAVNAPTGGVHREESRLEGPESRSRRRAKIWRSQYAERGALRRRTRRARADRGRKCRRAAAMSGNSPITFGLSAHVRLTARSWSIQLLCIDSFVRPIGDSLSHMTSTAPCTRINRPVAAGARAKAPCGVSEHGLEHGLHSTCVFMDCMLAFSAHAVSLITSCSADSGRGSRPGRHDRLRTFHPRPLLTHGRAHCGHRC